MALTLRHWIGAGALACAALAVGLLPPSGHRTDDRQGWSRDFGTRNTIANALRRDYQISLFLSRRDDALAQLRRTPAAASPRPGSPLVLVDARRITRVSPLYRRALEDSAAQAFGPFDAASHAVVFATSDTELTAPGGGGWVGLTRWVYVFPEATDGRTCLAIAPIGRRSRPASAEARNLLGPCAYYAAFGQPGPAVAAWLQAMDYYPALESDWLTPRPRPEAPDLLELLAYQSWGRALSGAAHAGLSLNAGGCAAGKLDRCNAYIGELPWFLAGRSQRGVSAFIAEKHTWRRLDEFSWYLADLVREMGRDRFGKFWRSPLARDSAFAEAYGMSMNEWTHRWLAEHRPDVLIGPRIRLTSALLGFLVAALLVAGGAYYTVRRQVG